MTETKTAAADTVTLTRAEYEALLEHIEDLEHAAYVARREATGETEREEKVPWELAKQLMAGEHPIKVWRRYRGMADEALAAAAGISQSYLAEIETGKTPGSFAAFTKIARALDITLDDIAAWLHPKQQVAPGSHMQDAVEDPV